MSAAEPSAVVPEHPELVDDVASSHHPVPLPDFEEPPETQQPPLPSGPPPPKPNTVATAAATATTANGNNTSGISIWDFVLYGQHQELQSYIQLLHERDDVMADEKGDLTQRILEQRVESSVRFKFINPVIGQHGYLHVNAPKSANKYAKEITLKGTTPLHYAAHLRLAECCQVLLQGGADPSLMDEKDQTPYRLARLTKDERLISVFLQHRAQPHRIRKQLRSYVQEVESSRKRLVQFEHDVAVLTHVRQTLMAQVVALWWRFTTSMVRRELLLRDKRHLMAQLDNLTRVSSSTIEGLEKDKQSLTGQVRSLSEQVLQLQEVKTSNEQTIDRLTNELADRDRELADRNSLRGEINKLQQALKVSLELMASYQSRAQSSAAEEAAAAENVKASGLQLQLQMQQSELVRIRNEAQGLEAAVERARLVENQLRTELEAAFKKNAELRQEVVALRNSPVDVQAQPEFVRVVRELEATRESLRQMESDLEAQKKLANTHALLAQQARQEAAKMATSLDVRSHPEFVKLQRELGTSKQENERLRQELENTLKVNAQNQQLQQEVQDLQGQLEKSRSREYQLQAQLERYRNSQNMSQVSAPSSASRSSASSLSSPPLSNSASVTPPISGSSLPTDFATTLAQPRSASRASSVASVPTAPAPKLASNQMPDLVVRDPNQTQHLNFVDLLSADEETSHYSSSDNIVINRSRAPPVSGPASHKLNPQSDDDEPSSPHPFSTAAPASTAAKNAAARAAAVGAVGGGATAGLSGLGAGSSLGGLGGSSGLSGLGGLGNAGGLSNTRVNNNTANFMDFDFLQSTTSPAASYSSSSSPDPAAAAAASNSDLFDLFPSSSPAASRPQPTPASRSQPAPAPRSQPPPPVSYDDGLDLA
eukprot:TRINITY_DN3744_c0_g1_i1.p1 TRINITY_DN3744_c0_g1~~TRINITY_DN3744_c0_g1_i1.p1  ORF type:complete len:883 (+),score=279.41 TRINITY_DN3744_c0_g1_i1:132-2780(+)